ncbi:hypothetical protein ATO10_11122 [Actibacterium atlanticum]|uniref:DUF2065 domain-containing protein n=1 Tax=Actibacterium atlanticum TaxID=1461693 RepID=A0A058ZIL6_9RHOB|nr:DUF2065 domain-containing protein [Actibacterium atlanticum]KCV81459.1 hypothetical protein ATO10_11122 [Actibacterium atlanticum]
MGTLILAIGLVLVFEGLVFALAPSRLEDLIKAIEDIPPDTRRLIGLLAIGAGVALVWLAQSLGT